MPEKVKRSQMIENMKNIKYKQKSLYVSIKVVVVAILGIIVLSGCGTEPLTSYQIAGHQVKAGDKILVMPFMDTRTFVDPNDPYIYNLGEHARDIFADAIKSNRLLKSSNIITPAMQRPEGSLTVDQVATIGKEYGADIVVCGQIFSFVDTRAASIPPRAGMFIRIVSVHDGALMFVGDHYQAAAIPGATGGRELQARHVANLIINSFVGNIKPTKGIAQKNMVDSESAWAAIIDETAEVLFNNENENLNINNNNDSDANSKIKEEKKEDTENNTEFELEESMIIDFGTNLPSFDELLAEEEAIKEKIKKEAEKKQKLEKNVVENVKIIAENENNKEVKEVEVIEVVEVVEVTTDNKKDNENSGSNENETALSVINNNEEKNNQEIIENEEDKPLVSEVIDDEEELNEDKEIISEVIENSEDEIVVENKEKIQDKEDKIRDNEENNQSLTSTESAITQPVAIETIRKNLTEINTDPSAAEQSLSVAAEPLAAYRPKPNAKKILMLPYYDLNNPQNLIKNTGGGEVVTALFGVRLAKDNDIQLLWSGDGLATHQKLLTIDEAITLGKMAGADYVVRGEVVEFRRAKSVPSFYSVIISTGLLAAQMLFAEVSGVDVITEMYRVDDGRCVISRRDMSQQKYVVQAEKTVRRLATAVAANIESVVKIDDPLVMEPMIDTITSAYDNN